MKRIIKLINNERLNKNLCLQRHAKLVIQIFVTLKTMLIAHLIRMMSVTKNTLVARISLGMIAHSFSVIILFAIARTKITKINAAGVLS